MNDLRIKLAAFWFFIAGAMLANTILYFVVPGVIDEIGAGEIVGMQTGAELILGMAIAYFWVPLVMAVISLTLKDKANQLANIILGAFYAVFILFELTMNVTTVAYPLCDTDGCFSICSCSLDCVVCMEVEMSR